MAIKTIWICIAMAFLLFAGLVIAQDDYPDVIEFEGSTDGGGSQEIHPSTYTGPITFKHQKHIEEYVEGCEDCHHDSNHEPIEAYDPDETYTCADCHDGEGMIRGPIAENGASIDDLIEYRANVLHLRCIGCHKAYNAEQHVVIAPEACRICHTKRPQEWVIE